MGKQALGPRIRYNVKKPGGARRSFSIWRDVVSVAGVRSVSQVQDPRIDAINKSYKAELKDLIWSEIEIRNIVKDLKAKDEQAKGGIAFNSRNHKLLDRYWEYEYASKRIVDHASARNSLKRAIDAVGDLSLQTASREEIEKRLRTKFQGNRQRRIAASLNQLLKFAGRTDCELRSDDKDLVEIRYLSAEEALKVVNYLQDDWAKDLMLACFGTGGRVGEVFSISEGDVLSDGTVHIRRQLDREGVIRRTKNRKERPTLVLPFALEATRRWAAVPLETKRELRNKDFAGIIGDACRKAFPGNERKHCTIHDMRHSFAKWMLSRGVSLSLVAQALGNSVTVCQEYYGGWELTPESIVAIRAIISR